MKIDNRLHHFTSYANLVIKVDMVGDIPIYADFRTFIEKNEVPFGISGKYVYVYTTDYHMVKKFKLVKSWNGDGFERKDLQRDSDDYIASYLNNAEGEAEYQICQKQYKGRKVKLYRCPGRATKKRGNIKKQFATHFDFYVR